MPKTKRRRRTHNPETAKRAIRRELGRHIANQARVLSGRAPTARKRRKRAPAPALPKIKPLDRILATLDELIATQRRLLQQIPDLMAGRQTVASWGQVSIPAGASHSFEVAPVALRFRPDRLLVMPSSSGLLIDSIRLDGTEQLVSPGVPVEIYGIGTEGLVADRLGMPLFGPGDSITLRNPSGEAITVSLGLKGRIETDRARAERLEQKVESLRAELERAKTVAPPSPPTAAGEAN